MFDLRRDLMGHLQRMDVAFFDRNPVGRLVTRVTTDVDALNELLSSGLVAIFADLLMLVFIVVVMFRLSPGMTLLMLGVMPLVILTTAAFRRSVSFSSASVWPSPRLNSYLQSTSTETLCCSFSIGKRAAPRNSRK